MRRIVLSALMVAALLGARGLCLAQESKTAAAESSDAWKPVVVVSFAGYDQARKAIETIDKLGDGTLSGKADAAIEGHFGAKQIPGLDPKRPWGAVVQTDGQQFPVVGFLPVTDLKRLLAALEPQIGKANEAGKGVYEIGVRNQTVYVTEKNGWAFIAPTAEHLDAAPKDPVKLLGGLSQSYDLAVRLVVKNVPPLFRQMLLGMLQMGMQRGAERMPGETEEQHALRTKMAKQGMQQMTTVLNELDTLVLGVRVDAKSSSAHIDYEMTALAGTKTARQLSDSREMKSRFTGVLAPDAAFCLNVATRLAESDIAQAKNTLAAARSNALKELDKQGLSDADRKQAGQMLGDLIDVLQNTLQTGQIDVGMMVVANANVLTVVAGAGSADTAKLNSVLKQLVPQIRKENPELAEKIKLHAQAHEGVEFHTLAVPTAMFGDAGPKLTELVGENLEVVIGAGPKSLYVAAGRNAAGTLTQVIDRSKSGADKAVPPMRLSVAIGPIAKAVAAHGRREVAREVAGKVVKLLDQTPGQDHIRAADNPIANGDKVQIVIEPGVLKVIASAESLAPGK